MKHTAYFFTIISLFIACKQNIKNEKTDEATVVTIQTPNLDSATTKSHQAPIAEQPKTKDELWNEYWAKFTTAIQQKDKKLMLELALKKNEVSLDGESFFDGGGGGKAEDFVDYIDEDNTWKGWLSIANNKKVKITKEKNRSIVDDYMIFEFIKDEWVWIGVMGD
jgi:hypothetical protein